MLETYPFSDPNPVPVLVRDPRLYPYHLFEGYSVESEPREWKVVVLENDLVQVFVLPEIGGKVWGAVVKKTGREFVYRNEVVKFRNIALRGPWTSGGIEFNFGVIGHAPTTATPVDYALRSNDDGSASVFVGAMDLPSRTRWRVEIRLPADQAAFTTRAFWHNPTPLEQPYYNWMTAAAFARDDLELFVPGRSYLEHSGRERPWPEDEAGRFLPQYRNNAFGGHKSYHVVGELNDFFGGYYHAEDWGWGHWARHEDMPGRKMWLWALSREGGVWEELLTDSDGQYVEFQAGRLFVQYSPGDHVNPISQAGFDPVSSSSWTETWFPVQGLGGLSAASPRGAMHVRVEGGEADRAVHGRDGRAPGAMDARAEGGEAPDDSVSPVRVHVAVHAFGDGADTLQAWSGGRRIAAVPVRLAALEPFEADFAVPAGQSFEVRLPALALEYDSDPAARALSRPFETDSSAWSGVSEAARRVFEGEQFAKGRRYKDARRAFERALAAEPWNRDALLGMAELALRSARYEDGLRLAGRALQLDAYDAEANFLAGNLHAALGRTADARDAFGWSARSMAYRAASYARLARVVAAAGRWAEAKRYAARALEFDARSVPAWEVLAVAGRRTGDVRAAGRARAELAEIDPLHHFARAEEYLAGRDAAAERRLLDGLRGEHPAQSLLELAVGHAELGLVADALRLVELADRLGANPVIRAWRAFLAQDASLLDAPGDPAFSFPFRPETLPVLRWAAERRGHWTWRYLLALEFWALDREEEAARAFESLGDEPGYGPAYATRGLFLEAFDGVDPAEDLARAVEAAPGIRPLRIAQIRHEHARAEAAGAETGGAGREVSATGRRGEWDRALRMSAAAMEAFPGDYDLELLHARALVMAGTCGGEALGILERVQALPSENSRDNHRLFVAAHVTEAACLARAAASPAGDAVAPASAALAHLDAALAWPENLGQGRPYDPDERAVRLLAAVPFDDSRSPGQLRRILQDVVDATPALGSAATPTRRPPDREEAAMRDPAPAPRSSRGRLFAREDLPAALALYALGSRGALAGLAAGTSESARSGAPPGAGGSPTAMEDASPLSDDAVRADRMVRQAAAWLADPGLDRCTFAIRIRERFPDQFRDVDGRVLLIGARLATRAWALGRPVPARC